MGTSEILGKKLDGLLFGLKKGTKTVTDVLPMLNRLKATNALIYEDYERKYINILRERKQGAEKKEELSLGRMLFNGLQKAA